MFEDFFLFTLAIPNPEINEAFSSLVEIKHHLVGDEQYDFKLSLASYNSLKFNIIGQGSKIK